MVADDMRSLGYVCRRETICGQGYYGGDGITCYRVRDPQGRLVSPISTHRSARAAWAEARERLESVLDKTS